ncbi:hypothetical protein WDU94_007810 [Cyamophila willieti]
MFGRYISTFYYINGQFLKLNLNAKTDQYLKPVVPKLGSAAPQGAVKDFQGPRTPRKKKYFTS